MRETNRKKTKLIKVICIIGIIIAVIFVIIIMPLLLNKIYNTPGEIFYVDYALSDILAYYGTVLSFVGTIVLGSITLYQNHKSQKKTDEINALTIELQKKSMAMAEKNFDKEKHTENVMNAPKFEIRNVGCRGNYMNLCVALKNVSHNIASMIKSISFEVLSEDGTIITTSKKVKTHGFSLSPSEKTEVEFNNSELMSENKIIKNGYQVYDTLKNIKLIWKFQCEDVYGVTHYYRAKLDVDDTAKFDTNPWNVEKVG